MGGRLVCRSRLQLKFEFHHKIWNRHTIALPVKLYSMRRWGERVRAVEPMSNIRVREYERTSARVRGDQEWYESKRPVNLPSGDLRRSDRTLSCSLLGTCGSNPKGGSPRMSEGFRDTEQDPVFFGNRVNKAARCT